MLMCRSSVRKRKRIKVVTWVTEQSHGRMNSLRDGRDYIGETLGMTKQSP